MSVFNALPSNPNMYNLIRHDSLACRFRIGGYSKSCVSYQYHVLSKDVRQVNHPDHLQRCLNKPNEVQWNNELGQKYLLGFRKKNSTQKVGLSKKSHDKFNFQFIFENCIYFFYLQYLKSQKIKKFEINDTSSPSTFFFHKLYCQTTLR